MNERKTSLNSKIQNKFTVLKGILVGVLIISSIVIVYFFLAFDNVGYNQYGLNQNDITQKIEDKIYEKGFYHIGIINHFIKFPKTVQTIEFYESYPLDSRTKDGLLINIQLSFQYRLRKSDILELYGTLSVLKNVFLALPAVLTYNSFSCENHARL